MRQDRLLEIVGRIYQRPETWNQNVYHEKTECGTAHCVAGHAQVDAGDFDPVRWNRSRSTTWSSATSYLELSEHEAGYLFDPDRSIEDLVAVAVTGAVPEVW